uniref:Protein transport protein Sec31A n=1 Tax=Cyclopterus lumpus TaxID=8103 RepID=A0A8C3A9T2_CYCLU
MKLKEINRTAIQSWSPAQHHPIYLATGTSAQQLDASFSTNASLEFFELDLTDPSLDMKSCGSLSSSHRYHKLAWGPYGMDDEGHPSGVLIAGGEHGNVILYDAAKIMAGETDVIIAESDKHTGPVRALDVNPFQTNLVASGGNESEIYIWDMNNFGSPMTPGPKTQPLEDISCVAWNRQVQHILASASPSGRASVWDLRKNDLIIKVSDHSNRMHCSGLAWNPEVATQLVLSSEDDRMPVIQMWDLRFATSPFKILENHTRGVLSINWSLADPELLLSCGKDNRILCWNPNTAEVVYELPTSSQWCFDIQWCPRNPAVLSAASFDGHIDVYSIMGGTNQAQSQRHISNAFVNLDPFGTGQTLPPLQLPQTAAPPVTVNPLKKPPKWIRRPVGASFAFGGKLVSLENAKPNAQQPASHVVHISQVVTETAFLKRSDRLQATLSGGDVDGLITQALLTGDFEGAVELCLHDNRMADSIILAIAGGAELLEKTQKKYFTKTHSKITKLISAVVMKDWHDILKTCDLQNWKEALAAVMTYAQPEEFSSLCDLLGGRLEAAVDAQLQAQACLCYICAGNVEKLVSCWTKAQGGHCPLSLQDLVEKVVVLRRAVEQTQRSSPTAIGILLAEKMSQYAGLLASQGSLSTAITYLPDNTNQVCYTGVVCVCVSYPQVDQYAPGSGGAPLYQPHQYSSSAAPPPAEPPGFFSQYTQPTSPVYPGHPPVSQCLSSSPTSRPPFFPSPSSSSSFTAPPSSGGSFQHGGPGSPVSYMPHIHGFWAFHELPLTLDMKAIYFLAGPQNGWNDPPALNRASKKKPPPMNYTPPAPITAPIMAPLGADPQAQLVPSGAPQQHQQHQQQQLSPPMNPALPKTSMEGAPGAPTGDVIQPLRSIPAEKIMKKPIPEEHLVLKNTFEGLIQKCLAVATDPQTKRKLDDANKRLEALYDKLREQTLSPAIVGGLHNIARSIESRAYAEGLGIHTHIVSHSNFSETSAFMPVLKVVLTQANKLGV